MSRMRKWIFILTVLVLTAGFGFSSEAKERRKVTVLFPAEEDSLLYSVDDDGTLGGMMSEYFDALEKCTGWDIEYVTGDLEELFEQFYAGEIDIMGTALYTEDMEQYADYPMIPSGSDYTSLAAKNDNSELVLGDISSINEKTVAVTERQKMSGKVKELEDFCSKNGVSVNIKVYDNQKDYLDAVDKGEADLLMVGSMAKPLDLWEVIHFNEHPYYTVVSEGKEEILNELNTALYTMHRMTTDYTDALYRKYFSKDNLNLNYAFTKEEKKYLSEKKTLRAVVTKQFTKKEIVDGVPQYSGFMVDVAEYFAGLIGMDIEYVMADGQTGVEEALRNGEADFAPSLMYLFDTEQPDGVTVIPYSNVERVMVTNLEEKGDKDIVAVTDFAIQKPAANDQESDAHDEELVCGSLSECMERVYKGDATVTYMDMFTAQYYIMEKGYSNLSVLMLGQSCGELCIGIADNCDAELLTILEKAKMYTDEDEITQVILQNVINQKTRVTVKDFVKQNLPAIISTAFIAVCIILTCIFWAVYSRMKRRSAEAYVEERLENERQLSAALSKANAATVAKSRFLSNVSHEMRTPLNGLAGMLTLLNADEMSEEGKEHLRKARQSTEYLMKLVSHVLDMTRITDGEEELNNESFEVSALLRHVQEILSMQAKEKQIKIQLVDRTLCQPVWGDAVKLRQILLNIAGNSIKFLQRGGEAGIVAGNLPDKGDGRIWYEFCCWDNGPGVDEDYIENIFKPFSREEEADSKQIRGTGLGLAIVKGIVDLFGGTIEVSSQKGEGITFCIQLPFEKVPDSMKITEDNKSEDCENILAGKQVLVAEDNDINLQIIVEFLKVLGITAEAAVDGEEVVEQYLLRPEGYYDAILMDIQMPKCDGYEAAERIRKSGRTDAGKIPIIATTANAFQEDIEKAKSAGMNGHIAKPIDIQILASILKENIQ